MSQRASNGASGNDSPPTISIQSKAHKNSFSPIIAAIIIAVLSVLFYMLKTGNYSDMFRPSQDKVLSLMVLNARIWTGDYTFHEGNSGDDNYQPRSNDNRRVRWAQALAVHKQTGLIIAIGSNRDVLERFSKSMAERVLDFSKTNGGNPVDVPLIVPGFVESHAHVVLGGKTMLGVQLRTVKNRKEFVSQVVKYMNENKDEIVDGGWITGAEWVETSWEVEGDNKLPHKDWIDPVTPNNPVYLMRMDGHSCLVNSRALQLANITSETVIQGGTIDLDPFTKQPTGILRDKAMEMVQTIIPQTNKEKLEEKAVMLAQEEFLRNGITSVHEMGSVFNLGSWNQVELFTKLHQQDKIKVRLYATVELETHNKLTAYIKSKYRKPNGKNELVTHALNEKDSSCCWLESEGGRAGDYLFKIGALKEFMDGSLGSRTALLYEPFEGTNFTGLLTVDLDKFYQQVKQAEADHHQVIVHAIGDKAVTNVLDIFERVIKESSEPNRDRRWRIEHAQQIREEDIDRFKKLNIIVSMQPVHLKEDALYAESVIGPHRTKQLFNTKKFMDKGVTVALGSDWFVAPLDVLDNIHAAVTRKPCLSPIDVERRNDGSKNCPSFVPEERITIEQALVAYTQNAAHAGFSDDHVGVLKKGYFGDLTILSRNLFELDEKSEEDMDSITTKTHILMTVIGGKIMYENQVRSVLQK